MVIISNSKYEDEELEYFNDFPYELSDFQKHSINGIVNGKHILVTAHTGSGKTLPAEFSINYFVGKGKKVIYTSPIKALSNQKYHEFTEKFKGISFGILTGDIKFNPEADVLIMTTEILKNSLYQRKTNQEQILNFNIDIENELGCVVFDEVHYINDKERGKVWEETIIMLPDQVQMVMLSATIDRVENFAAWIEKNKSKDVVLTGTNKRVVPLIHYSYFKLNQHQVKLITDKQLLSLYNNNLSDLVEIKATSKNLDFNEKNFYEMNKIRKYLSKNDIRVKRSYILNELVRKLHLNNMLPAICFIFSRKNVEVCASEITVSLFDSESKVPSIIEQECKHIMMKLPNYREYINLPEYVFMINLLKKGIAVHHSGIIPVLREMVELLFSKGYIKLLFATETFAVGINMPTKTVIFTSFSKFDGNKLRNLLPHEYTQMAGRAGRRGLDTIGHVIHCNNLFDDDLTLNEYKNVLNGNPQKLVSKFKISYNVVLNLLQMDPDNIKKYIEKSLMLEEITGMIKSYEIENNGLLKEIEELKEALKYCKTPYLKMEEYDLKKNATNVSGKKRKKINVELSNISSEYPNINNDMEKYNEVKSLISEIDNNKNAIKYMENYIETNISKVIKLLQDNNFVNENVLNERGVSATQIQEIHPLVFVDMLDKYNNFKNFEIIDLIGLFSCFTNVTVKDELKDYKPKECSDILKESLEFLDKKMNDYYDLENKLDLDVGIEYNIHYDIISYMYLWCNATNEEESKEIIYKLQTDKGVFLGEFVKCILKINNITNEIINICELCELTELNFKLSKISEKTMKFIATNQSLYI